MTSGVKRIGGNDQAGGNGSGAKRLGEAMVLERNDPEST